MTEDPQQPNQAARRRDWILLPLLAMLTVLTLVGTTEVIARHRFHADRGPGDLTNCFVRNDPIHGVHAIPGCSYSGGSRESEKVLYQFDQNGYRNPEGILEKSGNAYRIGMIGSSVAMGDFIPQAETIAAQVPQILSKETKQPVVLYNEGLNYSFTHNSDIRFPDVLRIHPQLILWVITYDDVREASTVVPAPSFQPFDPGFLGWLLSRVRTRLTDGSLVASVAKQLGGTSTGFAFRYYAYRSPTLYLKSYLSQTDAENGYLRKDFSSLWIQRLLQVQRDMTEISRHAHLAHIPLVVVYVPLHAQARMIAMGHWPAQYDPYHLDDALRSMVTADGDLSLDILPDFRAIPLQAIQHDYLLVDGHPNARGQKLLAQMIADALLQNATIHEQISAQAKSNAEGAILSHAAAQTSEGQR